MRSRSDLVDEAVRVAEEQVSVLWALGLNSTDQRRAYFESVTGLSRTQVVGCLARLANVGLLAETDGLQFRIAKGPVRDEILDRMAEQDRISLAEASLNYAEEQESIDGRFLIDHALHAGQPEEAARLLLEEAGAEREEDLFKRISLVHALERTYSVLEKRDDVAEQVEFDLGCALIVQGEGELKQKTWRWVLSRMESHALATDSLKDEWKAASEREKARVKAEKQARQSETASEDPAATTSADSGEESSAIERV